MRISLLFLVGFLAVASFAEDMGESTGAVVTDGIVRDLRRRWVWPKDLLINTSVDGNGVARLRGPGQHIKGEDRIAAEISKPKKEEPQKDPTAVTGSISTGNVQVRINGDSGSIGPMNGSTDNLQGVQSFSDTETGAKLTGAQAQNLIAQNKPVTARMRSGASEQIGGECPGGG